ncbi:MAG: cupin domain-containing protein [Vicinamibacterales bacterium]
MVRRLMMAGAIVVAAGAGYVAGAAQGVPAVSSLNAAALKVVAPENIKWTPAAGLTGTDTATLYGNPSKPGFYIQLNRFHPGNFSRPHWHENDRFIMVVSGTWWVATGARFDPETTTVPLKAGTFVTHTGREVHYDGDRTGSDDAVVMIFGQGPGARHECTGPTAETTGPCAAAPR